jgi:phage portal protein BeeE
MPFRLPTKQLRLGSREPNEDRAGTEDRAGPDFPLISPRSSYSDAHSCIALLAACGACLRLGAAQADSNDKQDASDSSISAALPPSLRSDAILVRWLAPAGLPSAQAF